MEWIKVKDVNAPMDTNVLICQYKFGDLKRDPLIQMGYYCSEDLEYFLYEEWGESKYLVGNANNMYITHWMTLPKPPSTDV